MCVVLGDKRLSVPTFSGKGRDGPPVWAGSKKSLAKTPKVRRGWYYGSPRCR